MNTRYLLLDAGNGERLEQWGPYRLRRPDAGAAMKLPRKPDLWKTADAQYEGEKGKGQWRIHSSIPEHWNVSFGSLQLIARLAPYKHTGIFPEQEENWNWMRSIAKGKKLSILNLFAYTGGATVALALDGHFVTHVDSARPSIGWAKENALLNHIPENGIRWMLEDAPSFATKEVRRGKKYDAIVLDPPAYGHGPNGKTWRVERDLAPLLENCVKLLSPTPSFIVLNGYAQHDTPESFRQLLAGILHTHSPGKKFILSSGILPLTTNEGDVLDTGIVARCRFE